ncbi:MAG: phosphoglucosamine mutase [Eubacteriales bacterium]|nr:phosphoglucosamine mutase [Eubacteriales bacterium]
MGKYFGTDGVRGVANTELTPEFVYKLGRSAAYAIIKKENISPTIIVGMDTRKSGDMLEASLIAGMCSIGAKVVCLGVIPTPAVAYLIRKYKADAGVVISASHNPFQDNGIKFFNNKGFKLSDELENEIEDIIDNKFDEIPYYEAEKVGHKEINENAILDYVDFLANSIDGNFEGINLIIDCANGATYKTAPALFEKLKANTTTIFKEPNGININNNCGSTHMETLCQKVKEGKFDVGIAFDGDGDRCLAVDENGEIVDGDCIMAICGNYLKEQGKLKKDTIVATVMSNLGLFIMGKEKNIEILKANVGDRYVLEEMLKNDYNFGGEQSGHIIFLDYNTTGDGILTAIQLINIIKKTGKKLSELKKVVNILPQALVNAKVDNKKKYDYLKNEDIKNAIAELEKKFEGEGRVLIRPSGTEPLVRVMIEGKDQDILEKEAKNLAQFIEKVLG